MCPWVGPLKTNKGKGGSCLKHVFSLALLHGALISAELLAFSLK